MGKKVIERSMILFILILLGCGDDTTNGGFNYLDSGSNCPSCRKWEKCSHSKCVFNIASRWNLILSSAVVSQKKSNGDAWDTLGGLPDPVACVTINGQRKCSSVKQDTLTPYWNEILHIAVGGGSLGGGFSIELTDSDWSAHDQICSGNVTVGEADFNLGGVKYDCSLATIRFGLSFVN